MAQKLLNGAEIGPRVQEMRRERVAQGVDVELPPPRQRGEQVLDGELDPAGPAERIRPCISATNLHFGGLPFRTCSAQLKYLAAS